MTHLQRLGVLALLLVLTTGRVQAQGAVDAELLIDPVTLSMSPDEAYRSAISFAVQQNVFIVFTDPHARLVKMITGTGAARGNTRNQFEVTFLFEPAGAGTLLRIAHHVISGGSVVVRGPSREAAVDYLAAYLARYAPASEDASEE